MTDSQNIKANGLVIGELPAGVTVSLTNNAAQMHAQAVDSDAYSKQKLHENSNLQYIPFKYQTLDICKMWICINPVEYFYARPVWKNT